MRGVKGTGKGAAANVVVPVSALEADKIAATIISDSKIGYTYSVKEGDAWVDHQGAYSKSDLEVEIEKFVNTYPDCQVKWVRDGDNDYLLVCNKYSQSLKSINVHNPLDKVKGLLFAAHGGKFEMGVSMGGIDRAFAVALAGATKGDVRGESINLLKHNVGAAFGWYNKNFEGIGGKLYEVRK